MDLGLLICKNGNNSTIYFTGVRWDLVSQCTHSTYRYLILWRDFYVLLPYGQILPLHLWQWPWESFPCFPENHRLADPSPSENAVVVFCLICPWSRPRFFPLYPRSSLISGFCYLKKWGSSARWLVLVMVFNWEWNLFTPFPSALHGHLLWQYSILFQPIPQTLNECPAVLVNSKQLMK